VTLLLANACIEERSHPPSSLPRVDKAEDRLRERQRGPGFEELFELMEILPRQTVGEVFARIGRAAKRGLCATAWVRAFTRSPVLLVGGRALNPSLLPAYLRQSFQTVSLS
jgi:hypothetical protein